MSKRALGALLLLLWGFVGLGFLMSQARVAMAAGSDLVVTTTVTSSQNTTSVSDQLDLALQKDDKAISTKRLLRTGDNGQQITFNAITFSDVEPGSYQVCLAQLKTCQAVTKTANKDTITFAAQPSASNQDAAATNTKDAEVTCDESFGALGWLACPVMNGIQTTISHIEKDVITPFLETKPLSAKNEDGSANPIYSIWAVMRTAANALFIIVFLVVIFAQATSIGLDNYTIKRMLPRLVAAAILVQLSFLICSLGVDIANILGQGVQGLINGVLGASGVQYHAPSAAWLGIGALVATVALAGAVLSGAVFLLIISAFIGVMAVFLTLIARQIIITFLIISAPIAFILWVLPNTQSIFTMWQKNFVKLLLMYPLIVLLLSASKIVAVVAAASGSLSNTHALTSGASGLIALAAAIVPLFLIPQMFKLSGSMMATTSGWVNKYLRDPAKSKAENSAGYEQLKNWSNRRKESLKAGQGVSFGALSGNAAVLGGDKARFVFGGGPMSMTKAAKTRDLKTLRKQEKEAGKELDLMEMGPDGLKMVLRGPAGARDMINDEKIELGRMQKPGSGASDIEIASQKRKVENLQDAEALARQFYGKADTQMAAANKLGEMGMLDGDKDRGSLATRGQKTGSVGKTYTGIVWGSNKFKLNDADPVLASTALDGFIDLKSVERSITGRPPDKLKAISKDGMEAIAGVGMLDKIDAATVASMIDPKSPYRAGDAQIKVIKKYLEADTAVRGTPAQQSQFLGQYNPNATTNEIIKDKALLGGLISDASENSLLERNLRIKVNEAFDLIQTKLDYVTKVEGKTAAEIDSVSDGDFEGFQDYRDNVWYKRVDHGTGTKKDWEL